MRRPPSRLHALRALLLLTPLLVALTTLPQDPTAPWPRKGAWLGKEICLDCHEQEGNAIAAGHHATVIGDGALHACETCHGPGQAHGDDADNATHLITHPRKVGQRTLVALCGQCHRDQIAAHGGDPAGFVAAGKDCTACHKVHEEIPATPHAGLRFDARTASLTAEPTGAARCLECHPLRDQLLAQSVHHSLAAAADPTGCEQCHGNGALHAETGGLARLITRPDRAADGIQTCRGCHAGVDPVEFHWVDRPAPLLSSGLTCTTCHRVHEIAPPGVSKVDPDTGQHEPVTNALCAQCHAPAMQVPGGAQPTEHAPRSAAHGSLAGTVHETLGLPDTPLAIGCGACHLGAEAHARAGGRKELLEPLGSARAAKQLSTCGKCHEQDEHLLHVRAGAHHRNDVSCLHCHSPAPARDRVRTDAERNCASCHRAVEASFRQPNHHPVPEGHMACSDCHEPHGARSRIRDLELRERRCVTCHTQYRGPFVFAHQASRSDGCVVCHAPHGSSNKRMLLQATPQQNCLQCHGDFPAFHDQTQGSVFINCLNCHTEVHGSHFSRYLFR